MNPSGIQRVAILRHGYYPGDPRVYKEAHALQEAGYEVEVICLRNRDEKPEEMLDGIRVFRLGLSHRRGSKLRYMLEYGGSILLMALKLSWRHLKKAYDLVQVNTLPDELVFATLLPRLLGARILLDMHEPTPELYLTKYGSRASSRAFAFHARMEQLAIRYAYRVLTVNDALKDRYVGRGAPGSKITVVRNVPAEEVFIPSAGVAFPSGVFCVVTHGTLQPRYGHEVLLRAVPLLRDVIPGFRLLIVGDGETAPVLKQLAQDLKCADVVEFAGSVPLPQVPGRLALAQVGVVPLMPSPFSDLCQPNKLFEYVALGIPVVAARFPAMREGFDGESFLQFTPGDPAELAGAIGDVYRNPEPARRRARKALEQYEALRWSAGKQVYLDAVKGCLNG
ncbi:MAG: glycosyltransferase family 4 protein [Lentisphaerota bacterium]